MRKFHCITAGVDIQRAALELAKTDLWNRNTLRKDHPSGVFRAVDDIWLRMADMQRCAQAGTDPSVRFDHRESVNYPAWYELHNCRTLVMQLMATVGGIRLGRSLISRLRPGARMLPHSDIGKDLTIYYDNEPYYSRYHIVIQGYPGSLFRCEDETVCMQTGQVWWFRNDLEHEVINNSSEDRIHIVTDIRS